jgi:hypothetical protein
MADVAATYRIEHRHDGTAEAEMVAHTADEHAPATALAPLAEVLTSQLASGEFVPIEQRSERERMVTCQPLWTSPAAQAVP